MYTMKNFAAQQLSKAKMNHIKGGWKSYNCEVRLSNGYTIHDLIAADSINEAVDEATRDLSNVTGVHCVEA